jgi:hypothetical protein
MHCHFKPILSDEMAKPGRNRISFRDKIERRAKTQPFFQFQQVATFLLAFSSIHIMFQYKSKSFFLGPPLPSIRGLARPRVYWPYMIVGLELMENQFSSKENL